MNICFVSENYEIGGIQRVTFDLGKKMETDFDVFYYSLSKKESFYGQEIKISAPNNFCSKLSRYLKTKILKKISKSYDPYLVWKRNVNDLITYIRENDIDLVILNGGLLTSFSFYLKNEFPTLKIISWQHNEANIYFSNYYNKIEKAYKRGLIYSDGIVCLTPNDLEVFKDYNKNTYFIKNIVNLNEKEIIKYTNENEEVIIGFCSRYNLESKGLDMLVEIVKNLPFNYKLHFAGTGTKEQIETVSKIIEENGLSKRIILLGSLKEEKLNQFYQSIDIFISTSRWEGFGLVIVEAMSYGVPIISFNNSGPNMILSNGEFGILIEKYDIERFAEAIVELISSKESMQKFSKLSTERSRDFSVHSVYKEWKELIKSMN